MASNFPSSLDTFSLTNPTSSDSLNSPSHSAQHANVNDAVEALQAKVGADSSAVTTSHDYKIADHASRLTTLEGAAGSGLVFISRTTVGSAVSSVTVSNVFSSEYDSYRIIISNVDATHYTEMRIQFGAVVTGYYGSRRVDLYTGATSTITRDNNTGSLAIGATATTDNTNLCVDVQNPNLTNRTVVHGTYTAGGYVGWASGLEDSTTQHTAFNLLPGTGTFTGGTIDVYGYAKA
jgi:hypothetical protein